MDDSDGAPAWRTFGRSVRGSSHARSGLPNQDAIKWFPESDRTAPQALVVADGHGSAKYFRSDIGARFAARCVETVYQLACSDSADSNPSALKQTVESWLPRSIVREWSAAVDEHVAQFPFTEEEWTHLSTQLGSRAAQARASIEANPRIAYGTTMLAAAITHRHLLAVQLGDGDIVLVTEDGAVSRAIERDPVLIANETHSLCQDAAWRWFRTFFLPFWNAPPALVLLSTDGYANSFREDAGFLQIGTDLLSMLRQSGPDAVHEVMASWLAEASRSGSGDDVTLGVMCRLDALAIAPEPASNETEPDSPDVGALHDASATAVMAGEPTASERPDNDLSETPHA